MHDYPRLNGTDRCKIILLNAVYQKKNVFVIMITLIGSHNYVVTISVG